MDQEGGLIYYAATRSKECVLRRVIISSFLKRQEYEEALKEDSASFMVSNTVSDLWCLSKARGEIEIPQKWPWKKPETRSVRGEGPAAIAGLLTWNGWPHKLFWGYDNLPIDALAFGYDSDFNPTVLIVLGRLKHNEEGARRLQTAIELDVKGEKKEMKIADHMKLTIKGGMCKLISFGKYISSTILRHDEDRDPPVLMLLKTTASSCRSGEGFYATVHLDNSRYDHYHKAKVHIGLRRNSKENPWRIEINIERGQVRTIDKRLYLRHRHLVQHRPAYRLGTWDDQEPSKETLIETTFDIFE